MGTFVIATYSIKTDVVNLVYNIFGGSIACNSFLLG